MGKIQTFPTLHKQLPNNERWQLTMNRTVGRLVASPLGIGWIDLDDGSRVQGFRQADAFRLGCVGRKVRFVRSFGVHTLVPDQYVWRIALARQM